MLFDRQNNQLDECNKVGVAKNIKMVNKDALEDVALTKNIEMVDKDAMEDAGMAKNIEMVNKDAIEDVGWPRISRWLKKMPLGMARTFR